MSCIADLGAGDITANRRRTPGAKQLEENRRKGLKVAHMLLKAARETGVLPFEPGDGGEAASAIPEMRPNSGLAAPIR